MKKIKLSLEGRTMDLKEWSKETGIKTVTLHARLNRGWTDKETLTLPVRIKGNDSRKSKKKKDVLLAVMKVSAGEFRSARQWSEETSIEIRTAKQLLKHLVFGGDGSVIRRVENERMRDHGTRNNPFLYAYQIQ